MGTYSELPCPHPVAGANGWWSRGQKSGEEGGERCSGPHKAPPLLLQALPITPSLNSPRTWETSSEKSADARALPLVAQSPPEGLIGTDALRPTLPCSHFTLAQNKHIPHLLPKLPSASDNNSNKSKAQRI